LKRDDYASHKIYVHFVISPAIRSDESGDSYSSIEYNVKGDHPNEDNPLGNPEYPGITYSDGANWVLGSLSTH
jgi:hypothetical protein